MSYIVPRDIPKGCEYCPFNGHTKCRMMPIGFDEYPLIGRRPDWCPLIEVPEPKRGKWISKPHKRARICSCCGYDEPYKFADNDAQVFKFCPFCGADMREVTT